MTRVRPDDTAEPSLLSGLLDRVEDPEQYERWLDQVARTGHCSHPVRLAGRTAEVDVATGELREVYTSADEPDGTLLVACGNRRASRCPSCSATYRRDAFQVIAAGLRGGKSVPETVASHPRVFATFTAPSFGPVHARRVREGRALPCQPRDPKRRCAHRRPVGCWRRHADDDPALGAALCAGCLDVEALVLWNAVAPALWRRTLTYTRRELAKRSGLSYWAFRRRVRLAFVKVAEYQTRGAVHFHAVFRLDAAPPREDPARVEPPPDGMAVDLLADALRAAVVAVAVPLPVPAGHAGPVPVARWGGELDLRPITPGRGGAGELSEGQVAGYIAKYATKGAEGLGLPDRRLDAYDAERVWTLKLAPHVARLVDAAWRLGGQPHLAELGLRRWAHMLGFPGHFATKSRRYSTTFTRLRRARVDHVRRSRAGGRVPLDAWGRPETDGAVVRVGFWSLLGVGYASPADAWLAASAAARAREHERPAGNAGE